MLRERIGVWEEDSIYWVKKSPSFDEKSALTVYEKPCFFSFVSCVRKRKLWPRTESFFVKRGSFLIKSPLKMGGIFTFLFSQLCELRRKEWKSFFSIRLVFTKWLVRVLFSHFCSLGQEMGMFKNCVEYAGDMYLLSPDLYNRGCS
jgi:hypothetical protein